jgi:cytochrome c553
MKPNTFQNAVLALLLCATSVALEAAGPNFARELAANCANCHGTDGKSSSAMPSLAGLERSYLILRMQDFKAGRRPATIMHQIAKGYSDEQIELIAEYFASQK